MPKMERRYRPTADRRIMPGMGEKVYVIAMSLALLAVAWNVLALLLHLVGINLPGVDVNPYG